MTVINRNKTRVIAAAKPEQGLPLVIVVGRANAGKSTLFNRIGRRHAIVNSVAGTTRDVNYARAEHAGRDFTIADSGGLELGGGAGLTERVVRDALRAVGAADVVVFLADGRAGLSAADHEAFALIRQLGRPLLVAVNKLDQRGGDHAAAEYFALGAEHVFPVSASHGLGMAELLDAIVEQLPAVEQGIKPGPDLRAALIGRPNVGKSSLLNRLVGYERALVDAIPGTTRDPVDVRVRSGDSEIALIDTAGIRRRTRVEGEIEQHSVGRAIETIHRAEVLMLVIDATEGITDQDARLARLVDQENRALLVICNKWDAAAKADRRVPAFVRDARERYPFLEFAPMLFTSALTGDGVERIIPEALAVGARFRATFQTSRLNRILADATAAKDPPQINHHPLNLLYVTQVSSSPPRLAFFANFERDIPAHYVRYLENRYRAALDLTGTPLRLDFRKAHGTRPGRLHTAPSRTAGGRQR